MPTIPLGNFGNQLAASSPGVSVDPEALGAGVGRALAQVGNTVASLANAEQQKQQQERLRLAGAKAQNAQLDYEQQLYSVTEDLQRDMASGKVDYNTAPSEFQKRVGAIKPAQINDLDPVGNEIYGKGLERLRFKYGKAIDGLVEVKRKDDAQSQFGTAVEKIDNLGNAPGADPEELMKQAEAFAVNAKNAGIPSADVDRKLGILRERLWVNQARNRMTGSMNDPDGLQKLLFDLSDEKGMYADKFDANQRTALVASISTRLDQLSYKQQQAMDRRDAQAQNKLNNLRNLISTGLPVAPDVMDDVARASSGTALEGEFLGLAKDYAEVQQVMRMPPADQMAYLSKRAAQLQTNGVRSMSDLATLNRLQNAIEAGQKQRQNDPISFDAASTGTPHAPINLQALDDPNNRTVFSDRVSTLAAMRKKYGESVPVKPLTDAESQALGGAMRTMSSQQQAGMLWLLKKQIGDDKAFQGAIKQMFPDDPVLLAAGLAAGENIRLNRGAGRPLADLILTGRRLLADKTVLMPKNKGNDGEALLPVFNATVGTAIPMGSPAREAALQTTRAIYATLAKEAGNLDGTLDPDLMEKAVELATGGVVDYNDQKTLRPYSMSTEAFIDRVRYQVRQVATGLGMPAGALDDLPLEYAGGGKYYLRNGLEFVKDAQGRPVMINVEIPNPPKGGK